MKTWLSGRVLSNVFVPGHIKGNFIKNGCARRLKHVFVITIQTQSDVSVNAENNFPMLIPFTSP